MTEAEQKFSVKEQALKTVARGASIFFFGILLGRFLGYLIRALIARTLGPANYGIFSLGISVVEIAGTLALLGLPTAINRYVPFYLSQKKEAVVRGTIRTSFLISAPAGLLTMALLILLNQQICLNIYNKPALVPVLRYFAIIVPFFSLMMLNSSIFTGFKRMDLIVYTQQSLRYLTILIVFLVLLFSGFGIKAAIFAYPAGYFITAMVGLVLAQKLFPIWGKTLSARPNYKEIISFSWPLILVSMIWFIIDRVATLMLGYFKTAEVVGIYNAALPLAQFIPAVLQSFTTIFMPIASSLISSKDIKELRKVYATTSKWILVLTLPLFLLIFTFSEQLIALLFGAKYISAAPVLQILAFGFFFHAIVGPTTTSLNAFEKTKITLINTVVGFAVNITLHLLLIPRFGIIGAAVASAVALILINLLAVVEIFVMYNITPFSKSYLKVVVSAIVPLSIILAAAKYFEIAVTLNWLIIFSAFFLASYFLLLYLLRSMEADDVLVLKEIQKKIGANIKPLEYLISRIKK
ncbi:MAG: flippase [Calditrichaeota bacterium]|nr:flippase [Calditrichota bacterium]